MQTSYSGKHQIHHLACSGMLLTLAMIFSYIEALLPTLLPLPGFKLGFANIVIIFCAASLGIWDALVVSLLRVLLSSILFSSLSGFWFSISGALCAFIVLSLLLRRLHTTVSWFGISVACAAAHNAGQLCAAFVLLSSGAVFTYLPVLLLISTVTGTISGMILTIVFHALAPAGLLDHRR